MKDCLTPPLTEKLKYIRVLELSLLAIKNKIYANCFFVAKRRTPNALEIEFSKEIRECLSKTWIAKEFLYHLMEIWHRRLAKQFIEIPHTSGKMWKLFPNRLIESTRDCVFYVYRHMLSCALDTPVGAFIHEKTRRPRFNFRRFRRIKRVACRLRSSVCLSLPKLLDKLRKSVGLERFASFVWEHKGMPLLWVKGIQGICWDIFIVHRVARS